MMIWGFIVSEEKINFLKGKMKMGGLKIETTL